MENKFYDELETLATYPLALLSKDERKKITTDAKKAPSETLSDVQKNKIAGQIDQFLDENEQVLSEHIHEVRVIDSINKLREKCDSLGIPWEKAHIVQTLKKSVGKLNPTSPLLANLPNDFLLPFLLAFTASVQDLKKIFHSNQRLKNAMSDGHAVRKLCRTPFYEWGISGDVAIDFLTEFSSSAQDLAVDLSFCQDVNDTLLRKLAKSCPNLVSINLSGCKNITDDGIKHFATNHHLRHIYCFDCPKVTSGEETELRQLLPHCTIYG